MERVQNNIDATIWNILLGGKVTSERETGANCGPGGNTFPYKICLELRSSEF